MSNIINESTVTQVWRWVKELGAGATFTTKDVEVGMPHLTSNRLSASLSNLAHYEILARHSREGRTITWRVTKQGAERPVIPRNEPKASTRARNGGYHKKTESVKERRDPNVIVNDILTLLSELQERTSLASITSTELLAELTRRQQ